MLKKVHLLFVVFMLAIGGCSSNHQPATPEAFLEHAFGIAAKGDIEAIEALVEPSANTMMGDGYSRSRAQSLVKFMTANGGLKTVSPPVLRQNSETQPMFTVGLEFNNGQKTTFYASVRIINGKFYLPI